MKASVLIVDNDSHTRDILLNALLTEQYNIVGQMRNRWEVVARCVEIKPDLVLLGVTMPNMDELNILQGLRTSIPSVPVVIVSGDATADLVKNALANGAAGIIVKPFTIARVLEVVRKSTKSTGVTVRSC